MAESKRRKIITKIVERLEGIDSTSPFETRVDKVFDGFSPPVDTTNDVLIGVIPGSESRVEPSAKAGGPRQVRTRLPLTLRCVVKTSRGSARQLADKLIADIERALFETDTNGRIKLRDDVSEPSFQIESGIVGDTEGVIDGESVIIGFDVIYFVEWSRIEGTP